MSEPLILNEWEVAVHDLSRQNSELRVEIERLQTILRALVPPCERLKATVAALQDDLDRARRFIK